MVSPLEISSRILDRIVAETVASPDREICGLLFGTAARIDAAVACANVARDPRMRFEIDPAALIAAHRAARAGGPVPVGHYHSHPTGVAEPSPRDAEDAVVDGTIWLIAAGMTVTAWRAGATGAHLGRFEPLGLRVVRSRAR